MIEIVMLLLSAQESIAGKKDCKPAFELAPAPVPGISPEFSDELQRINMDKIEKAILYEHLLRENQKRLSAIAHEHRVPYTSVLSIKKKLLEKLREHFKGL